MCKPEFVADTLASIRAFTPKETRVVLIDDSRKGTAAQVADARCVIIEAVAHGTFGALYLNLCEGFRTALREAFDVLLRIDTDALVAGEFTEVVHDYFTKHPKIGSLGSYRMAWHNEPRSFSWAALRLLRSMTLYAPRHPRTALAAAATTARAKHHGYTLGENIMGGVAVYSHRAVAALGDAGFLPRRALAGTVLQEDQIFALALRSIGFGLADFGTAHDDLPFGVKYVGLPAHPDVLLAKGKALIHSTKSYEDLNERQIRAIFAAARRGHLSEAKFAEVGPMENEQVQGC
jgi:hypothetical protein